MTYKHIKVQLPAVPMGQGEALFPQTKEAMQEYWLAMSAPDLLVALKALLEDAEECGGYSVVIHDHARAAIAKATGRTA